MSHLDQKSITKICTKCGIEKDLVEFCFRVDNNTYRNQCKECKKQYSIQYNQKKIEKIKQQKSQYYQDNKNIIDAKHKLYNQKHKEEINTRYRKYQTQRRKVDINYKLSHNLRVRLYEAVKNNFKSGSAVRDLGCTIEELKIHLEKQFKEGMTWDNYGKWHIDHIIPISSFNLQDRKQLLKACNYENLQPLWAEENLSKSGKI